MVNGRVLGYLLFYDYYLDIMPFPYIKNKKKK